MIDEIIVHVGMHKTGSSSIQETLSKVQMQAVEYLSIGPSNHSAFFSTLLSKHPENYHTHRKSGLSKSKVRDLQLLYVKKLHTALQNVTKKKVLISAEDLSSSSNGYSELEYLKELLVSYCKRIRIVGYVRPPAGYMQSAFQQRMKGGGQNVFDLRKVYPCYKQSFAKMDDIFGQENVELIAFKRDSLHNGDVVQDFARRIEVDLDPSKIVRTNESLSLEATALLFVFRHFSGKLAGYKGYNSDNNRLIAALSGLGNQKLVFSESALSSVFEANRSDIEWMSQRLGTSIVEDASTLPQEIGSEKDLFNVAYANRLAIWSLLKQQEVLNKNSKDLAKLVDRLYLMHAVKIAPLRPPENVLFSLAQLELIPTPDIEPESLLNILADALAKNGQQLAAKGVRRASKRAAHLANKV